MLRARAELNGTMSDWNQAIIDEFRANGGKAEAFGDNPLVILHTIGARSGQLREIPLVALLRDDAMFVFASAAGSQKHPDWFHNLKANPQIDIEFGTESFSATVTELDADDAAARLGQQAELMPQFADYVTSAAPRVIPAFRIDRN